MSEIKRYKLEAAFSQLINFDSLAGPDDFIEVIMWENGEGFDVNLMSAGTEQRFGMNWASFKAMKKMVKELDKG